ncbi:hypothetical protein GB931_10730 [Modestobacter sp. I12A-02628]|uniref:Uncharacterized protein n=1 Tax=Goekera deserti TaxID=2497753 RepID=A0A7K3WE36_9ACTN|nr:hypothetical protein [Goekera deserti]MPQ98384.1 hypothetical protein [Goekera deserti]NDI48211.1 hypothetical protein [Goekera deserti]NEL53960.1 hypothetical protein [Goekera deserti]
MSNATGTTASREEEIAFLAMEQVLGVEIKLADAGAGNKMPDGSWVYPDGQARQGIVEITSPPATRLMNEWARAKRAGQPQIESGSIPSRLNELAQVCFELLQEGWARENLDKLLAQPADERHLFLFARSHKAGGDYFYRLSDTYDDATSERVDDLVLPLGISDVWFRGRAQRDPYQPLGTTQLWLARFQAGAGWHRYVVNIEERGLPSPNPGIADDRVPTNWRLPKDRTAGSPGLQDRADQQVLPAKLTIPSR